MEKNRIRGLTLLAEKYLRAILMGRVLNILKSCISSMICESVVETDNLGNLKILNNFIFATVFIFKIQNGGSF